MSNFLAPIRNYAQYADKPKTTEWLSITPRMAQQFFSVYDQLAETYDIDTQEGEQLDVIGVLVGIDRSVFATIIFIVYECGDTLAECGDSEVQCAPSSADGNSDLSDDYYRLVLKAKIIKNIGDATIDNILRAMTILLDGSGIPTLIESPPRLYEIQIQGSINSVIETIVLTKDVLPRPLATRLTGITVFP